MIIQVLRGNTPTSIYVGQKKIATLPTSGSYDEADLFLKLLGLRRYGKWETTEWGWEAKVGRSRKVVRP